jgi:hypothetical protein
MSTYTFKKVRVYKDPKPRAEPYEVPADPKEAKLPLYRVRLQNAGAGAPDFWSFIVLGNPESGERFHFRPRAIHYRDRAAPVQSEAPWLTKADLERRGFDGTETMDSHANWLGRFKADQSPRWTKMERVRLDLSAALCDTALVRAEHEHKARLKFMSALGISDTIGKFLIDEVDAPKPTKRKKS